MMLTKKIFLASSCELKKDRIEFENFISRKYQDWVDKGVLLKSVMWEDFLDTMSKTRLQNEYNTGIQSNIDTGGGTHVGGSVNTGGGLRWSWQNDPWRFGR